MNRKCRQRVATGMFVMLIALSLATVGAEESITLEVVFAGGLFSAGRDPNVNVVQDYGDVSWTQLIVEEFQKEHPHINVVFRSGTMDQTMTLIATGGGPDIIHGWGHPFVNLGRQGAFVNLSPLMERDGIDYVGEQIFWEPQYSAFNHQGEQFAFPEYLGTIAIGYNADLFANAGLENPEPRTDRNTMDWDEFESLARKLTYDQTGGGVNSVWGFHKIMGNDRMEFWLKAAGAEFYGNDERTLSALDSAEAIEALDYLRRLRWEAEVLTPPGWTGSWEQGQVAMVERGTWDLVRVLGRQSDGTPKVGFEWNVFPMPTGPSGERATLATLDGYAINRNTNHLDEAYALLKFLAGPEANEIRARYLVLQPSHRHVVPEYLRLVESLNTQSYNIHFEVFTDAGAYAYPQLLYSDQDVAQSILNEAYSTIFNQNQPAGPVWSEAIQRLNRVLSNL